MHPLTTFRESAAGAAHSKRFAIKKITIMRQPWAFIQKNGSISVAVHSELGSHQIIIDSINANQATIRDPFHGWRITIPTTELLKQFLGRL